MKSPSIIAAALLSGVSVLALPGCFARVQAPDLNGLYDQAAMTHDVRRNPVIVIPGILGSRLVDEESDTVVWGAFTGVYANPQRPEGARLAAVPMREGESLRDLHDGVRPDGVLDRLKVSIAGLPVELNAYLSILGTLGVGGYRDEGLGKAGAVDYGEDHYTCFQFAYDWRRDNVENAARLHEFILDKRSYLQDEWARRYGVENADVNFDIVAHSMGGLISRYYLRYGDQDLPADGSMPEVTWAGTEHVDRLIMIGTPNGGSSEAVVQLVDGVSFAPILPTYDAALLGTMPSIYQLLPRPRHGRVVGRSAPARPLDIYDPAVWVEHGWGLADPRHARVLATLLPDVDDPERRRAIALDHQGKCLVRARRFAEALDRPVETPPSTRLYLVAGDATPTAAIIQADAATGAVRVTHREPGDGTVLRSSALLDERVGAEWQREIVTPIPWRFTLFLFTDHLGLTRDAVFTDNVLHILLEQP